MCVIRFAVRDTTLEVFYNISMEYNTVLKTKTNKQNQASLYLYNIFISLFFLHIAICTY